MFKPTLVDKLDTNTEQDVRSVIDVLERALAEAKTGSIHAIAICMAGPRGRVGFYSSETSRMASNLLASVSLTHWRLCESMWHEKNLNEVETEDLPDPA